jgi:hypothetical protein
MLNFFISPFKSLFDRKFYKEYSGKSYKTAVLYVVYLLVLCAVFMSAYAASFVSKQVNEFVDITAKYLPEIRIADGIMSVNYDRTLVIEPEELPEVGKIVFDTGRTQPVYPTQLANDNISMLFTKDSVYAVWQGTSRQYEIAKGTNLVFNKELLLDNRKVIDVYAKVTAAVLSIVWQAFRLTFMILLALAVFSLANVSVKAGVAASRLLKLACYAQGPACTLMVLNALSPYKIPFLFFAYVILFLFYAMFALNSFGGGHENASED